MADFSIASQIRPMQLPDPLQQYAQFNQLALHQAQLAEVQRATNEQNQMRQFLASGGDPYSAAGLQQVGMISPQLRNIYEKEADARKTAGLNQELLRAQVGQIPLQNEKALGEVNAQKQTAITADHKLYSEMLNKVLALDDARATPAYEMLRAGVVSKYPELAKAWPETFEGNRGVLEKQMLTAEQTAQAQAAARLAAQNKTTVIAGPGGVPLNYDKTTNTYNVGQPAGASRATANGQPLPAAAGATAIGDAYAQSNAQIEGTGKNPMSSAQGLHQFIDSTFVGTAKKVFPELASKSPAEILALRGTKLADGTPIESALEQRFRTDNIASLTRAGIQPTPGNTYLAHFLGAGGARNVLSADPNTPVSQLLNPDAIAANKSVLEGKTAGDIAAWAANKFSGQPGMAASMTAGNARLGGAPAGFVPAGGAPMSLGAPTVNNALMANMLNGQAPIANALARPTAPLLPAPGTLQNVAPVRAPATTIEELTARAGEAKLAEKGAEETQKLEINKKFTDAEREEAKSEFDKTITNLVEQYKKLGSKGMLVGSDTTMANRAKAAAAVAAPGLTTIVSPERGGPVSTLANTRQTMLSALMGATGMSAKNIDSNAEMRAYLNSLSNPGQPVETIVDTLNNLSERFGTNRKLKIEDLTGSKPQNPSSAKSASPTNIHDAADAILRGEK
jgi:hypothetical protein